VAHRLEPIAAWQVLLLTLQALQVAFLWLHDWIPLGRLNDVAAARGTDSRRLIQTTLIQSIPYSIGLWFSARHFGDAYPEGLRIWLWISYGLLFLGEIRAWWWPYLARPDSRRAARYQTLFGRTHAFLPRRHGMVPNTLHVLLHGLTAATLLVLPIASAPKVGSTATITIAATPERVWRLLAAIDEWPRWHADVTAAHLDGPLAPGAVFTWTETGFSIESTILKVEPARQLSWRGHAVGTDAVHAWQIERSAAGVVVTTTETFSGWLPTLLPGTMQQQLDGTLPPWLDALKRVAEQAD
jgi:uncharacterized protein YndB with AHSA1/START domain